jgi:glycosyltransferase involved in cell wall biosynthesis
MSNAFNVLCFSHLRWNFVYQRPQHLLSRWARSRGVVFFEEPVFDASGKSHLELRQPVANLHVAVPHLRAGLSLEQADREQRQLLDQLLVELGWSQLLLWYYTPMALEFSKHLDAVATVYDCMDELSGFLHAPHALGQRESELFRRADVVFAGGRSLFEAKRERHPNVHLLPSSVDRWHFGKARLSIADPADQAKLPRPRLGFFGVLDERLDCDLLVGIADMRPEWQLVMIGPVVKIDPDALPCRPNIHYLGSREYAELPAYIAGWDVAILPFARNEATRYISPTKTPEYLAAGKPVVATSIRDVADPYEALGLVRIADDPHQFVVAVEAALAENSRTRLRAVDEFLAPMSWDATWTTMASLIEQAATRRGRALKVALEDAAA